MPVPLTMVGSSASAGSWLAHLLDLGHDLGQRRVGIGAEPHLHGDDAGRGAALRGDVVDVLGGRDRRGDRRGDEALDQVGAGAGIDRGDGDDRLLDLRILAGR